MKSPPATACGPRRGGPAGPASRNEARIRGQLRRRPRCRAVRRAQRDLVLVAPRDRDAEVLEQRQHRVHVADARDVAEHHLLLGQARRRASAARRSCCRPARPCPRADSRLRLRTCPWSGASKGTAAFLRKSGCKPRAPESRGRRYCQRPPAFAHSSRWSTEQNAVRDPVLAAVADQHQVGVAERRRRSGSTCWWCRSRWARGARRPPSARPGSPTGPRARAGRTRPRGRPRARPGGSRRSARPGHRTMCTAPFSSSLLVDAAQG